MFKSGKIVAGLGIGLVCLLLVAATFAFTLPTAQPPAQAAPAAQATAVPGPTATPAKSEVDPTKAAGPVVKTDVQPSGKYQAAFNQAFAAKLGVSEEKLNSAFAAAITETTGQMVKDGALDANGAAKLQTITANGPGAVLPLIGQNNDGGKDGVNKSEQVANPKALFQNAFPDIAPLFKLSVADLDARLQNGQSLRDLAAASNVDLQTLKNTIQASAKTQLDAAVKAGTITQAQADDALKTMGPFVESFLDATQDPADTAIKALFNSDATWQSAAQLLNVPVNTLKDRVKQGQSVLEIAQAQKVDEAKLRETVQASLQAQLDDLVKSGKLSADQSAKISPDLPKIVDAFITDKQAKTK
jgi:hypothetical protein